MMSRNTISEPQPDSASYAYLDILKVKILQTVQGCSMKPSKAL